MIFGTGFTCGIIVVLVAAALYVRHVIKEISGARG